MQKTFFAILHKPTGRLFPYIRTGATYYDFTVAPPHRPRHKFEDPPRLFGAAYLAQRYVTEYCKGIRAAESYASKCVYSDPPSPRSVDDFEVLKVEITAS